MNIKHLKIEKQEYNFVKQKINLKICQKSTYS